MTVQPGDTQNIRFEDFLPLPVFKVTDLNLTFGGPNLVRGPNDTTGLTPTSITISPAQNALFIDWPDLSSASGETIEVDVFATVSDDPFADDLFLTNILLGSTNNTSGVTAIGNTASIADDGANGADPTPADNTSTDQTPIRLNPPVGLKLGEVTGQGEITWTVCWFNNANNGDLPVLITDILPPDTTFIPGSLLCLADGTSQCLSAVFNGAQNRIEVEAVLASDAGAAADSFPDQLGNEIVIEFRTQVSRSGTFLNQADPFWDENNDGSPLDEQGGGQVSVMTDDPVTTEPGDPTAVSIALGIPTLNRFGLSLLILLLAGLTRRRLVLAGKV